MRESEKKRIRKWGRARKSEKKDKNEREREKIRARELMWAYTRLRARLRARKLERVHERKRETRESEKKKVSKIQFSVNLLRKTFVWKGIEWYIIHYYMIVYLSLSFHWYVYWNIRRWSLFKYLTYVSTNTKYSCFDSYFD